MREMREMRVMRQMRVAAALALALLLVAPACGRGSGSGPAWPRSAGRVEVNPEDDGGESLEPQFGSAISAIERSEDRTVPAPEDDVEDEVPAVLVDEDPAEDSSDDDDAAPTPPAGEVEIEVIEVPPEDIVIEPDSAR
jgi:hypothetical protein